MPHPTHAVLLNARPADPEPVAAPVPTAIPKTKPLLDPQQFELLIQWKQQQLQADREAKRRMEAEEHPPVALPPFESLRVRLARERPPAPARIEGWLPQKARAMAAGQYKSGKTSLTINLSRSLLDGDPWLGVAPVIPIDGTLVVIDEMSETSSKTGTPDDQRMIACRSCPSRSAVGVQHPTDGACPRAAR